MTNHRGPTQQQVVLGVREQWVEVAGGQSDVRAASAQWVERAVSELQAVAKQPE